MNSAIVAVNILQKHGLSGGASSGGIAYDSSYQTLLDRGTALSYSLPTSPTKTKDNTFFLSLKAGTNNFSKFDIAYLFATDGDSASDFATLNIVSPSTFQCAKVSSPVFTPLVGFKGVGVAYLDTQWNPSINAVKFLRDNNSFGVYVMNNAITSGSMTMGAALISTSGQGNIITPRHTGDIIRAMDNTATTSNFGAGAITTSVGLTSVVRTASGNYDVYKNGVLVGNVAVASNVITNLVWYICAIRSNSAGANFDTVRQIGFAYAGGATNQLELYNSCFARLN